MSNAKKIFAGITAFLIIGLVILVTYPNYNQGGNKSAQPAERAQSKEDSHHQAQKDDAASSDAETATSPLADNSHHPTYTLTFTAFKTPDKIGVPGSFDKINLQNVQLKDKLSEALLGSTFSISTASVNTKDPTGQRDPKLRTFFFEKLLKPEITGSFESFDNGKAQVKIQMNGSEDTFEFPYTETENSLDLTGSIDMVKNFYAQDALASIAEACKDLHSDKTWSDVEIKVHFEK